MQPAVGQDALDDAVDGDTPLAYANDMKEETFAKLVASVNEAGEIKAGCRTPSRTYEIRPPEIRMVRERLDVSQDEFAVMIGVSTRTLQNWEQGRRQPEGPAKALLTIASRNPTAVLDALHGKRRGPASKSRRFSTRATRVSNA